MRKSEIKFGEFYLVISASKKITPMRIDSLSDFGGFCGNNLITNEGMRTAVKDIVKHLVKCNSQWECYKNHDMWGFLPGKNDGEEKFCRMRIAPTAWPHYHEEKNARAAKE